MTRDPSKNDGRTIRMALGNPLSAEDDPPTAPNARNARLPSSRPSAHQAELVPSHVPLDAVPVLAVPTREVPWKELGQLARQLLLHVDGAASTMSIVTATAAPPNVGARELARLASRGLLRWPATRDTGMPKSTFDSQPPGKEV
jgi:hypothetical protein